MDKIVPDPSLSIYSGGIVALGKYKNSLIFWQIEALCQKHGVTIKTPIRDIPEEAMDEIMNGTDERLQIKNDSLGSSNYFFGRRGSRQVYLDATGERGIRLGAEMGGTIHQDGHLSGM